MAPVIDAQGSTSPHSSALFFKTLMLPSQDKSLIFNVVHFLGCKVFFSKGGAIALGSKALVLREKINRR